ncbi:putative acetoin catabolism protein AcoX [Olsenella profusa F0195]|uniref:Putative acetoin catabolism protein AcoX n=2 Tax=Olsenella profusa TaxID=138595 RepID=U2TIG3_9ACTN|nr:putative acetoin catabolism protein AcoX [Olsenella profusa F0195]
MMPSLGIIANPASGKDIRRLVSYATIIDNQEKVNIVKRLVLAAQSLGVDEVLFMPDSYHFGEVAMGELTADRTLRASYEVMDLPIFATQEDTIRAAAEMERRHVGCIVVLGGDGTSRAVAKSVRDTPILPLSTGTNNTYQEMIEGTVAGMAAGIIAGMEDPSPHCIRDKRIEVRINGRFRDIALIDAAISDDLWVGARAIWNADDIGTVIVTRCSPASIGFSAAAGCHCVILPTDDQGLALELAGGSHAARRGGGRRYRAPIAAGVLNEIEVLDSRELELDEPYRIEAESDGMLAVDGEREVRIAKGDVLDFSITRNGPLRVLVRETLDQAVDDNLFELR